MVPLQVKAYRPKSKTGKSIQKIRKVCGNVNMYVARACGNGFAQHGMSKPCERCQHQLSLLGFKKIYYMNSDRVITSLEVKLDKPVKKITGKKISWGLINVRKQTYQVATTYGKTRCLSPYTSESDTDSDSDA